MSVERVPVAIEYYRQNPGYEMLALEDSALIALHFRDLTPHECERVPITLAAPVRAAAGEATSPTLPRLAMPAKANGTARPDAQVTK